MSIIPFPTVAAFGSDSDQPLKVLRSDLSDRVSRVNDVRSRLRRFGIRMISQDLLAEPRPLVHVDRGTDGLRNAAVCVHRLGTTAITTAVIDDVDVCWIEPKQ